MNVYADSLILKDALQIYFSKYHFPEGGYSKKWFSIKLGPLHIPLPNIKSRVDAVKIHDIHHILTEYNADWKGEIEIGGWEIASGCEKYTMAWLLNLGSFFIGMFLYPRSLFKAFMSGRRCETNLYFKSDYEKFSNATVGELRRKINFNCRANSIQDYFLFATWCAISILYHLSVIIVMLFVIYEVYLFLQ